ncbi:phage holin family protein [Psychromarinibacter sp. S121]|uniref:phage holin family protein n=1 Tax=Psychromarinibacter sp. S121 TaxID=3415127 RepID=UPI003C79AA6F
MIKLMWSAVAYVVANGIGLLIAASLLEGFTLGATAFIVAVLLFTVVQTLLGPLITKISLTSMPQLMGSVSLITIFVGLKITELVVGGMQIAGLSDWLAATLLVWIGSLLANVLLPIYVFKQLRDNRRQG